MEKKKITEFVKRGDHWLFDGLDVDYLSLSKDVKNFLEIFLKNRSTPPAEILKNMKLPKDALFAFALIGFKTVFNDILGKEEQK